jgi:YVTN family beta-propeller protein
MLKQIASAVLIVFIAVFLLLQVVEALEYPPDAVITRISVDPHPVGIIYVPSNDKLYILNSVGHSDSDKTIITVIDGKTNSVLKTIPTKNQLFSGVFAEDTYNLYIKGITPDDDGVLRSKTSILVLNTDDDKIVDEIPVTFEYGIGISNMVYEPDSNVIYGLGTSATWNSTLQYYVPKGWFFIIDQQSNRIIQNLTTDKKFVPEAMTYAPSNGMLYVAGDYEKSLFVIDPKTNSITATIRYAEVNKFGPNSLYLAYCPVNKAVYLYTDIDDAIKVVNTATNKIVASIPFTANVRDMLYSDSNQLMYILPANSDSVAILDPITNTIIGYVNAGKNAQAMAYDKENKNLYVVTSGSSSVSVIATVGSDGSITARPTGVPFMLSSSYNDKSFTIIGKTINVEALDFRINPQKSIDITVNGYQGFMELKLPKDMVDGISDVKIGRESIVFEKVSEDSSSTTINFAVPADADLVQIYGAMVVPEFGTIIFPLIAIMMIAMITFHKKLLPKI